MAQRKTTRRQFLRGESAVEALADAGQDLLPAEPTELPASQDSYLFQIGRRAMACQFQVLLNAGQHPQAPAIALQALDLIDELEAQMTVYRDESEVQDINASAGDHPVTVEPRLFGLLRQGMELYRQTGGAFDMTAGPLSELWGFSRRQGRLPEDQQIEQTLRQVGADAIRLDTDRHTIAFARDGLRINLNSVGKGYALDRAGELFAEHGVADYLLHGGHSSILARGSRLRADSEGWNVALRHPLRPDIRLGEIRLRDRALGTSGSANQFFHYQGRRLSHVLDPRSGRPAEGVLSATVLSPSAALADALATACFVLGEECESVIDLYDDTSAILVLPSDKTGSVKIVTLNMPDDEWLVSKPD